MKLRAKISLSVIGLYMATALVTILEVTAVMRGAMDEQGSETIAAIAESLARSYGAFVEDNGLILAGYTDSRELRAAAEDGRSPPVAMEAARTVMRDLMAAAPQLADVFIESRGEILLSVGGIVTAPPADGTAFLSKDGRVYLLITHTMQGGAASLGFALSMERFAATYIQPLKLSPRADLYIIDTAGQMLVASTDLAGRDPWIGRLLKDSTAVAEGRYSYRAGDVERIGCLRSSGELVFGVSLDRDYLLRDVNRAYILLAVIAVISAVVAFVVIALLIAGGISRPVLHLVEVAREIASRNYDVRASLKSGDELEILGAAFNRMAEEIKSFTGNLEQMVALRTEQLEQKMKLVEDLSVTDPLTGAFNRSRFGGEIAAEIERFMRYQSPFALVMFDIDYFKTINDSHGHAAGDTVLMELAALARRLMRKADVFARWGGDEFFLLLPETDLDGAAAMAEKLRSAIETNRFTAVPRVTCSFGVTSFTEVDDQATVLKRADDALYEAKGLGRNIVAVG
jgi:diguanylate cyclase (GGDEF)-like protein